MKRNIPARLAYAALGWLWICAAVAADGGDFYIGLGRGEASVEDQPAGASGTLDYSARSPAYRAFFGYQTGALRAVDLAAEAGWIDYGHSSQTVRGQDVQVRLRGAELAGLVILPLRPLELYARAGALSWSSDKSLNGTLSSRSGTSAFYGAGIGFRVNQLVVRAEWDDYKASGVERLQTYWLSVLFHFH
jgi:hypothetical protein